ncbi:MAG TPA: class I adenylate-forming enzyme family protein [Nitrospira sp.]|nr:class I adenylate-forming enzyme family protein [Nitrospira sp.]
MSPLIAVPEHIAQARMVEGLRPEFPWRSFADFFKSRVYDRTLANRPFLTYCDDDRHLRYTYTYAEFGTVVQQAAAFLHTGLGLCPGERLATILFNHDVTVVLYFAAWLSGLTVVPINAEEDTEKKRFILDHSGASAVCCWDAYADEVRDLQPKLPALRHVIAVNDHGFVDGTNTVARGEAHPAASGQAAPAPGLDGEALIVYTSGTTGPPKGVVLTAENLLTDADAIADWHGFGPRDRLMCVLPIHHVNGTVVTLVTPFYCKGAVVLNRRFKSGTFWRRLHDEQVTAVSVVPTLLEFLLEADEDLSPYRLKSFSGFLCGAGPLLKDTAARFEDRFGFPIRHGYGLSETTCYSSFLPTSLPGGEHRHWLRDFEFPSIGIPLRHNHMAILDGEGREVPETARGEICIRGGTVCAGYFKRDDANETAFRWGWFRSGDEGFVVRDERGRPFFFISGRLKELIIRGGVNISPLEIDDALKGHPSVQFAMAVPFENRYYGEEIAVYVVPRPGMAPSEKALREHCRRTLPFFKQPKVIVFGEDVPYTSTGKPRRLELKTRLASLLSAHRDRQFTDE